MPTETATWTDRARLDLALGDVLVVVVLVVLGAIRHDVDPLRAPMETAVIVGPFALGWLVASPLAGLYWPGEISSRARELALVVLTWFGAVNVALIVRTSPLVDGGTDWPFNLVMTGLGTLALVGWRVGWARFRRR